MSKTYCWVFSSSPYIQPSFSSLMSRVIISPSSKLRSVGLLPAMWGKMVLTRDLLVRLRPDDCDTEWGRLNSPMLPCSGDKIRITQRNITQNWSRLFIKYYNLRTWGAARNSSAVYLSCGQRGRWVPIWVLGWTCWQADWSAPWEAEPGEAPGSRGSSEQMNYEQTKTRRSARSKTTVRTDRFMFDSPRHDLEPNREPLSLGDRPDYVG